MREALRRFARSSLSAERYDRFKKPIRAALGALVAHDLTRLARLYDTDKWGNHSYTPHYARHFGPMRRRRLNVLEIGVGGYDDPYVGGSSLRMWKSYFPRARIFSLDLYDKSPQEEPRIRIFQGSQADPDVLRRMADAIGPIDIVIDDGSHINAHVLTTFHALFPHVREGGFYVVEDTQTSYWAELGGASVRPALPETSMGFFQRLVDGLNYEEFEDEAYVPTTYDRQIVAMHFYHNLVFIEKGRNEEGSNVLGRRFAEGRGNLTSLRSGPPPP